MMKMSNKNDIKDEVYERFLQLKKTIESYGYKIIYDTSRYNKHTQAGCYVDHGRKVVATMPRVTLNDLIGICHEIGHIKERMKNNKKRNRKKKLVALYEELYAWMYAIPIALRIKIPIIPFMISMRKSLYTYIK